MDCGHVRVLQVAWESAGDGEMEEPWLGRTMLEISRSTADGVGVALGSANDASLFPIAPATLESHVSHLGQGNA